MFSYAINFNSDLSFWDTSQVVLFGDMFRGTKKFNANISAWNVGNGTHFNGMFHDSFFNGPLNSWDMSSAEDLSGMFDDAINFNQPLSLWNVSKVTNMAGMFSEAISFNQDISSWDVSNVTLMTNMFRNADVFSQDLSKWKPNISEKPYEFQRNSYFVSPSFKNHNINNAIGLIVGILIVLGAFFMLKKPKINSDNITLISKELNSFAEKKQLLTKEELDAIFKISDYSFEVQKTTRAKYIRDINKRKSGFITRVRDEKDKRSFLYLIKK
jgi:surface protein